MPVPFITAVAGSKIAPIALYAGLQGLDYIVNRRESRPQRQFIEVRASGQWRPRVVYGRCTVGGQLVFAAQDDRVVHLVYVLCNGPAEQLDGIWVDGERAAIRRETTSDGARIHFHDDYTDHLDVWEYFAANGTGGSSLSSVPGWTANHDLNGLSYVHVQLTEPQDGFWDGIPQLLFLLRGKKVTYPGQSVAVWSDDAASIRADYLKLTQGIGDSDIHTATFTSARNTCREEVQGELLINANFTFSDDGDTRRMVPAPAVDVEYAPQSNIQSLNAAIGSGDEYMVIQGDGPLGNNIAHWLKNNSADLEITREINMVTGPETRTWKAYDIIREETNAELEEIPGVRVAVPGNTRARWALTAGDITWLDAIPDGSTVAIKVRSVTRRYTVNGIVEYGDNPSQIESDMDLCWQGGTVDWGGTYYFYAGADFTGAIPFSIEGEDIIDSGEFYSSPDLSDRVNALSFGFPRASECDWTESSVNISDGAAKLADNNTLLARNIADAGFISSIAQGERMATVLLRQLRLFRTATYRIKPGNNFVNLGIRPTDRISITDPDRAITSERFFVTRTQINPDWSVTINVREDPSGTWNTDTTVYHPPADPPTPRPDKPRATIPTNVVASEVRETNIDGTQVVYLRLVWDSIIALATTQIRYRIQGTTPWNFFRATEETDVRLPVSTNETWEYQLRHIPRPLFAQTHAPSEWTPLASIMIGGDSVAPGNPGGLGLTATPGGYVATWDEPSDTDYSYTVIRDGPSSVLDNDEVGFQNATSRGRISGTQYERFTAAPNIELRVFLKHVDRAGNFSDLLSDVVTPDATMTDPPVDTTPPATPTGVSVTALAGGYQLTWTAPTEDDYAYSEILDDPNVDLGTDVANITNASVRGRAQGTFFIRRGISMTGDQGVFIWVRHVDTSGNVSTPGAAQVNVVAAAAGDKGQKGAAGITFENAWASGTAYQARDVVRDRGNLYIATMNHTASDLNRPEESGAPWSLLLEAPDKGQKGAMGEVGVTWRGGWASGTAYQVNDIVTYQNSTYRSSSNHTANSLNAPGESGAPWSLVARAGTSGTKGEKGTAGIPGTAALKGDKGDRGNRGDMGFPGTPGTKGQKGQTGNTGPMGFPGSPGTKGQKGQKGEQF